MLLTPAQIQIAQDRHRFRVLDCGRRFGKTTLAVEEIKGKALAKPSRIGYIAPTYQQARDIAWEQLKKELRPVIVSVNESRLEIRIRTINGGESVILLRGWEAVETLRGQSFDFLVLDEVASMRNFWMGWNEVLSPTLTDRAGDALFISTPKGYNHFFDLFNMQDEDDTYKSFHFTTYDNPHIPREEIEREKKSKPENSFAQEYLAEFRKMEGLVYPEFSRDRHIFDDFTQRREKIETIAGVDFGHTNPMVLLPIEHDTDNHYWITKEWYKTGKSTAELIEVAKTWNINVYYPDPAEPDRIEEMQRAGLNCREVSKDIPKGIEQVRELFKANRLHIHKDCINTIAELESYRYPENDNEDKNDAEVPVKKNDHAMDAMRYALFMNAPANDNYEDYSLYGASYA